MSYNSFQQILLASKNENKIKNELNFSFLDSVDSISICAKSLNISYETFKRFKKFNQRYCNQIDLIFKNEYKNLSNNLNKVLNFDIESTLQTKYNSIIFKSLNISDFNNYEVFEKFVKRIIDECFDFKICVLCTVNGINTEFILQYNKKLSNNEGNIQCENNEKSKIYYISHLSNKSKILNDFINKLRKFK